MWHPLLSPFGMATMILRIQQATSSHVNGTGPGVLVLAGCLGLPCSEGKMMGRAALGYEHTAHSLHRAWAPCAQQGGEEVTITSPRCGDVAPGDGKMKGGPIVAFITEVRARLWGKLCPAERGAIFLLGECCFQKDSVWSFSCCACSHLTQDLHLLYCALILPLCLILITAAALLLVRCVRSYRSLREGRGQSWEPCSLSTGWEAASSPECAVCLQPYKPGQGLKLLSCSHSYHRHCIDLWHRVQPGPRTCPLCQRHVAAVTLVLLRARHGRRQ